MSARRWVPGCQKARVMRFRPMSATPTLRQLGFVNAGRLAAVYGMRARLSWLARKQGAVRKQFGFTCAMRRCNLHVNGQIDKSKRCGDH